MSLENVKRVDLFIETAVILVRDRPHTEWRFHVIGDGSLRLELEQKSVDLRLTDRIRFHGHREDAATSVAGLDVLVICSDYEGMPMVALEAAALEVSTVAHAVGGLIDVVPAKLQVERHDALGYSAAILRALTPDGRADCRRQAKLIHKTYSARRNAELMRDLYERVITEQNGRRRSVRS